MNVKDIAQDFNVYVFSQDVNLGVDIKLNLKNKNYEVNRKFSDGLMKTISQENFDLKQQNETLVNTVKILKANVNYFIFLSFYFFFFSKLNKN